MRQFRVRRQFRITLTLLLALCLVLFVESRIEAFAPRVKDFVALKAEDALGGKVRLSIGNLEGGILQPISFNEIELKDRKDAAILTSVVIDSIKTNYRLWDLFLGGRGSGSALSRMLSHDASAYVTFQTRDREHAGFVRVDGDLSDARVKGFVRLFAREKVEFEGRMTRDYFHFELRPAIGIIRVFGRVRPGGEVIMRLRARRLKVAGTTVSVEAVSRTKVSGSPDRPCEMVLEGSFETRRLVVHGRTMPAVVCRYRAADDLLEITRLGIGEGLRVSGTVGLKAPHPIDLTVIVDNMRLARLFRLFGADEAARMFTGTMNARVVLGGTLRDLHSQTRFDIRKGTLTGLPFDVMSAVLKGDGPVLHIEESRITRESGSLILAGELDMRTFGRGTAFDRIRLVSDDQAITWDRLRTAHLRDTREVTMDKKLSEEVRLGFRQYVNDHRIDESSRYRDAVQLEYRLNDGDSLAMRVDEGENFMGLQHRDTF